MKYFLFLIFIKLINAKINIDIKSGADSSDITIEYSGTDVDIVTDHEINIFGIDNRNLKEAVKNLYGRKPNDVFVRSPTPWNDLYKQYHWEEVTRVLKIKSARVKGITKKLVHVMSQDFENAFNNTIKVNAAISQTVENTLTTSWSKNEELTVSQEIEYDVNVLFAKLKGTTGLSFTSTWGRSEEKSETVTIGTTSAVEVELQPGQAATAILTAHKGYIKIEITYKKSLRGSVAVNFKKEYNGHHFYGPTVQKVMKSGDIANEILTTQIIKLVLYSDTSLKVYDKVSGKPL